VAALSLAGVGIVTAKSSTNERSTVSEGAPPPSSKQPRAAVDSVDRTGLTDAQFVSFARMLGVRKNLDGVLELTPSAYALTDETGSPLPRTAPGWPLANYAQALMRAYYEARQDTLLKQRFDAAERTIIASVPDGANAVIGHRTAYNVLQEAGLLKEIASRAPNSEAFNAMYENPEFKQRLYIAAQQLCASGDCRSGLPLVVDIARKAGLLAEFNAQLANTRRQGLEAIPVTGDPLSMPHLWGYEEVAWRGNGDQIWQGSPAVLQFHCCAGHMRTTRVFGLQIYTRAHKWLFNHDDDYRKRFRKIIDQMEAKLASASHDADTCDALTKEVREELQSSALAAMIEAKAKTMKR
jgi:hypothetical protein